MNVTGVEKFFSKSWQPQAFWEQGLAALETVLERFHHDCGGRRGGYLCVADEHGFPLVILLLGQVPHEKSSKYLTLCVEKAQRLGEHYGDISSWQTRDGREKWGGAIRVGALILSFSGLPEPLDELLVLLTHKGLYAAVVERTMDIPSLREGLEVEYREIAKISSNKYWGQMTST